MLQMDNILNHILSTFQSYKSYNMLNYVVKAIVNLHSIRLFIQNQTLILPFFRTSYMHLYLFIILFLKKLGQFVTINLLYIAFLPETTCYVVLDS